MNDSKYKNCGIVFLKFPLESNKIDRMIIELEEYDIESICTIHYYQERYSKGYEGMHEPEEGYYVILNPELFLILLKKYKFGESIFEYLCEYEDLPEDLKELYKFNNI